MPGVHWSFFVVHALKVEAMLDIPYVANQRNCFCAELIGRSILADSKHLKAIYL